MMSSKMGLKSALLTLAMLTAVPVTVQAEKTCPLRSVPQAFMSFVSSNKASFVAAAFVFVVHTRLHTRPRADFSMDDLRQDFKDLLNSLKILDGTKLFKQLVFMFDKYIIGLPVKIEDATTRTIKEDGTIVAVKGKKLTQKPFGAYGLFDAYVLSQAKKFSESLTGAALLAIYFNNGFGVWAGEMFKANSGYKVNEAAAAQK